MNTILRHTERINPGVSGSMLKKNLGRILCVILLILLTILRFDVIVASVLSLVFSLLVSITQPDLQTNILKSSLIEYWIAVVAWFVIVGFTLRMLTMKKSEISLAEKMLAGIAPASAPDAATVRRVSIGFTVIAVYFGVALLAPFLVPLDPVNQGDLGSTRFLRPLEHGVAWESHTAPPEVDSPGTWTERTLRNANTVLLSRNVAFSGKEPMHVTPEKLSNVVFLFGTDAVGRDVFSRVLYGARISLGIGLIVAVLSMLLGMAIGLLSGIAGGITDTILMRLIDILLSFPSLVLIILLFSILGGSIQTLILALVVSGWMGVARLVRGEVLNIREKEYIIAAKLLNVSKWKIVRTHIIPNMMPTIITASMLQLINSIMGEAALSFLGLGIQPPTASWGNMIGESIIYLGSAWWIGIFPGIALSVFAVSAQLIAEGIQECRK